MADSRKWGWVPTLVFLLGFACLLLGIFQPLDPFDEGFIVVAAQRILHGAVPYRDFAAYYAPGQFYTLAAVFRTFGSSILTERIWDTIVRFSLSVLVFLIARTLIRGRAALIPFFIALLFLSWCGFYGYPVVPAMLWALVATLLLIRDWPKNRPRTLFLAGLAVGISAFYRQDVGVYAFTSAAAALLIAEFVTPNSFDGRRASLIKRLEIPAIFGLGTSVVLAPLLLYFLWRVPPGELWADFMKLPRLQVHFRGLPLPPIVPSGQYVFSSMVLEHVWFLLYVPLVIFAACAVKLLRGIPGPAMRPEAQRHWFAAALLTLFGLLLLVTAATRADAAHCLAPTIPAAILILPLLEDWPRRRTRVGALTLSVCLMVLAVPYVETPVARWTLALQACGPWNRTSTLARARLFRVPADQSEAIRFVQKRVPRGQFIFVANTQQRVVFANDAMFYFLANRTPGTRYEEFEPGVVTTASVQREIVHELQGNYVNWVVLFSGFESELSTMSSTDEGSAILDDFLRSDYREVKTFGRYSILEKRGASTLRHRDLASTWGHR